MIEEIWEILLEFIVFFTTGKKYSKAIASKAITYSVFNSLVRSRVYFPYIISICLTWKTSQPYFAYAMQVHQSFQQCDQMWAKETAKSVCGLFALSQCYFTLTFSVEVGPRIMKRVLAWGRHRVAPFTIPPFVNHEGHKANCKTRCQQGGCHYDSDHKATGPTPRRRRFKTGSLYIKKATLLYLFALFADFRKHRTVALDWF